MRKNTTNKALRSRRQVIVSGAALTAAGAAGLVRPAGAAQPTQNAAGAFRCCLNTSTISGQNLGIVAEVDLCAKVGFAAIEPWIRELQEYRDKGGSLADLRKRVADLGLVVPDVIGFSQWVVDDPQQRKAGLEQAKRDMDLAVQIGATHIAAPPAGAQDGPSPPLTAITQRYRDLLELGDQMGITPMLELWGFSKTLSRVGEVTYVATEADHPKSCILLDIYHIYKGGSGFEGLQLLNGRRLPVLHTNDYPAKPPREQITDASRVYPGDGVAPLDFIFATLRQIGFDGYLSVELFNRGYWKESPLKVARLSLEKTLAAVQLAMSRAATLPADR